MTSNGNYELSYNSITYAYLPWATCGELVYPACLFRYAAVIRQIDEIRCFLDNSRRAAILISGKIGQKINGKNAH